MCKGKGSGNTLLLGKGYGGDCHTIVGNLTNIDFPLFTIESNQSKRKQNYTYSDSHNIYKFLD